MFKELSHTKFTNLGIGGFDWEVTSLTLRNFRRISTTFWSYSYCTFISPRKSVTFVLFLIIIYCAAPFPYVQFPTRQCKFLFEMSVAISYWNNNCSVPDFLAFQRPLSFSNRRAAYIKIIVFHKLTWYFRTSDWQNKAAPEYHQVLSIKHTHFYKYTVNKIILLIFHRWFSFPKQTSIIGNYFKTFITVISFHSKISSRI